MILDEIYKSNIFSFMSVLEKLQDKGLKLPPAPKAAGLYKTGLARGPQSNVFRTLTHFGGRDDSYR